MILWSVGADFEQIISAVASNAVVSMVMGVAYGYFWNIVAGYSALQVMFDLPVRYLFMAMARTLGSPAYPQHRQIALSEFVSSQNQGGCPDPL